MTNQQQQEAAAPPDAVDAVDVTKVSAGALVIAEDQQFWSLEQRAVLRAMGVDRECTNAELAAFLHLCQRRRLDPFLKQVYLIGRWNEREQRKVFTPQTSIDAFRLIARRAADKSGIRYGYEDPVYVDDQGRPHMEWIWDTPPAVVKFCVIRDGERFPAQARYGAYVQTGKSGKPLSQWRTMPEVMLAKCAEALALREAFPEDLGGIYTDDEMGQADNPASYVPPSTATVIQGAAEPADTAAAQGNRFARHAAEQAAQDVPAAPAAAGASPTEHADDELLGRLGRALTACGSTAGPAQVAVANALIGRNIKALTELTRAEAVSIGRRAQACTQQPQPRQALAALVAQALKNRAPSGKAA